MGSVCFHRIFIDRARDFANVLYRSKESHYLIDEKVYDIAKIWKRKKAAYQIVYEIVLKSTHTQNKTNF